MWLMIVLGASTQVLFAVELLVLKSNKFVLFKVASGIALTVVVAAFLLLGLRVALLSPLKLSVKVAHMGCFVVIMSSFVGIIWYLILRSM
jgi:hypothetical protein